ncbi:hypothetical protein [Rhodovibrio salinarum]|uniref:Uncharacterized protein n=1 Tax=Rhodovibrio salinarum TaxID=1087 RepID=A0A934QGV3_9PROT|nr:hypothetical protein [Rhodovibrio salinarum]MBK1696756.1 hypothetical protein [Rhodovibrio salinarum]
MPDTLVIQSHAPNPPAWLRACLGSVATWAATAGFAHRVDGDDFLARIPAELRARAHGRTQVVADLARLDWIAELLAAGWQRVIWLDADVIVFAPDRLTAALTLPDSGYLFGREVWIQPDARGHPRARRNLHNALLAFQPDNPVLDFYRHAARRVLARHDGPPVPQLIGPKLLTALDNMIQLDGTWAVGMASPLVVRDLAAGGGPALACLHAATPTPPAAMNLCASYAGHTADDVTLAPNVLEAAIAFLHRTGDHSVAK